MLECMDQDPVTEEHLRQHHGVTDGFAAMFYPGYTDQQWNAWHIEMHQEQGWTGPPPGNEPRPGPEWDHTHG